MMDGLTAFEETIGKPRTKWTKADWRMVAHELAGVKPIKGRPRLTDEQKRETEQNILAAEFWRDQAIETMSEIDGDVGTVINRKTKLRKNTATKEVVREAYARNGTKPRDGALVKKAATVERAIQGMQKNRRDK